MENVLNMKETAKVPDKKKKSSSLWCLLIRQLGKSLSIMLTCRLRELALFSLEKRRHWGDLKVAFQYLKENCKKEGDRHFSWVRCDRARGNVFKLTKGQFRLDIRKKHFITWVVKHWIGLSREKADSSSLETVKVRPERL